MQEILDLVKKYINDKHAAKKWEAGKDWVQYAGPYFDDKEYTAAIKSLLNEWLVLGEDGVKFENEMPKYFGKEYGIFTNSGSSANLIMLSALTSKKLNNFKKGTKVITPIAGFPTTINPIFQLGFEPLFVDIDLDTLNLNLDQVEEQAKKGAKIITFAHVLGNPPNMDRLMDIIKQYDLILLEDCCDALGSKYDEKYLGSFGEMASCSFYPAHGMTCGEGGFVATKTNLQEIVTRNFITWGRSCYCVGKKASLAKNGMCGKRFSNWLPSLSDEIFDHKYVYDEIGYNLKPIELQASIALEQIKKLPEMFSLRNRNHKLLYDIFKPYEEFFILPFATPKSDPVWFAFALTIKNNKYFKRKDIVNFLENHKIQSRQFFAGNIMLQPAYDGLIDKNEVIEKYPNARIVTTNSFFLGVSPTITIEQINYIKSVVDMFFTTILIK